MIVVHHLENSRSTRILWLLEELGVPYDMVRYPRDPVTHRRPESLKAVHPLGKAPVIEDGPVKIAESGAILEYLVARHGGGRLAPASTSPDWPAYIEWLHFAEGTAMLGPVMMMMVNRQTGPEHAAAYAEESTGLALSYLETALEGRDYLVGDDLTAADIQMVIVAHFAQMMGLLAGRPNLRGYLERLTARPAFQRAIDKGGPISPG